MNILRTLRPGAHPGAEALSHAAVNDSLPETLRRRSPFLTHPVFNSHHTETRWFLKDATAWSAHECILDFRRFKKSAGVEVQDVAKRLMDYGFHAPRIMAGPGHNDG